MSGRWWRAYSRARHDPKLLKLTDKDFRWWFNLVCAAADNDGRLPYVRDLAAEFRTTEKAIVVAIERLRCAGLFEIEGEPGPDVVYVPHNWNEIHSLAGRLPAAVWAMIRAEIFERDDYTCQYCGERGKRLECDHILAVAKGGSNDPENLATACFDCNRSKRDKTVAEWKGQ